MAEVTFTSPLEVFDFSGGKTDYYLGADTNKYQEADNLLLLKYGRVSKLFTRPGSEIYDATAYQIPAGAQRINGLKYFNDELYVLSARKIYYIDTNYVELQGPTTNSLFDSNASVNSMISWGEWNNHLFVGNDDYNRLHKIFKDSGGTRYATTAGLPRPANAPTLASGGGSGQNFTYRIIYSYTYEAGNLTFLDRGGYEENIINNVGDPSVNSITVSNIPAISNGSTDNWDTTVIKVEIYRTINNGTVFYYVGEVTNGTTSYVDSSSDATIQTNPLLYTEGGVPENGLPPRCKYFHLMDDKGYYAYIKDESGDINPIRIYQSVPGDIDSVPELNFVDVQDTIVGISSVMSSPIVFCKDFIYRLDGAYDIVGQGFIAAEKISDTAGCISHASIVQTVDGVFWAGSDGFYFTNGYSVIKVSDEIDDTYQTLITSAALRRKIQGVFDSKKLRVWWTVSEGGLENDKTFVLDLNRSVSPSMPFTTCSGGGDTFRPTYLEFIGEDLIRADSRGYVFRHADTIYSDPTVDTGSLPSTWGQSTIIYDYISSAMNFGTSSQRKFVPRLVIECKNITNLSLQPKTINDDGRIQADLKPIRYRGSFVWGEPDIYWGDTSLVWNDTGLIIKQRRFPAKGLRCQYKQVRFTNASVVTLSSDVIGNAVVDATAKTATLVNAVDYDWPSLAVDLYISFESDSYTKEFLITNRADDVLTFQDALGLAIDSASSKWVIRGKPKGEILQLLGYSIDFMLFGRSSELFRADSTGEAT